MAENKTQLTDLDPNAYVASIPDPQRRADCQALLLLMQEVTKHPAKMWGSAIVGFGTHSYPLSGNKTGQICTVGFASRKSDITLYGLTGDERNKVLLNSLGPHKSGKGCLYVKRIADVDLEILSQIVDNAFHSKKS